MLKEVANKLLLTGGPARPGVPGNPLSPLAPGPPGVPDDDDGQHKNQDQYLLRQHV